jgi:hypothetical protein
VGVVKVFWYCERCQQAGIAIVRHTDAMAVTYAIVEAHNDVSDECDVHYTKIRTLNFSSILQSYVPDWAVEPFVKAIETE